ncbi:curli-like amyloid fiber formation chaperone CsgH [Novosphingobium sp. JCM 18896]|uniref:curli-like amyloid fiber formation chaperone CsgH n=1 Tax=Novosphingobium sp. JCM 18896 TaxID=2989731 RepID=UPI0022237A63|nr:curli-like amyloid fiber formation chaperone CsgH [Novosphingobium sp. JCM 18896]MCW1431497.1 curli-like amyloid fiber formation chaperone CsgH [Novosphingobium sp. JCM 18896]
MRVWLAGLLAAFGATPVTAAQPEPVKVWIAAEPVAGGGEVFVGYASADSALTLRYQLVGEKRGSGGHSSVSQGGQVAVTPGSAARLSQVSFGRLGESDHYSIHLRVYEGVELRGETVLDR